MSLAKHGWTVESDGTGVYKRRDVLLLTCLGEEPVPPFLQFRVDVSMVVFNRCFTVDMFMCRTGSSVWNRCISAPRDVLRGGIMSSRAFHK